MSVFLYVFGALVVWFVIVYFVSFFYFKKQGFSAPKCELRKYKQHNFLFRLLVTFPHQLAKDKLTLDPNVFQPFGLWLICGKQGCGKTMLLTYLLNKYQYIYPHLVVKTNYNYCREDGQINHWQDLIDSNNGIYGEIDVIDEIHSWFSSLQSKNFPPEMLSEVSQQRKQRKLIIGTAQVFTRCAKPIREQTYMIFEPFTVCGCLTFVRKLIPILDDSGNVVKYKNRGFFFFIQNDDLRNSYDTYKRIENLAKSGFKPYAEQLSNINGNVTLINNENEKT